MKDESSFKYIPEDVEDFRVGPLPIIGSFCRKIGITQLVNKLIPSPRNIDSGDVVVGMIMDTLQGRSPLYKLHQSFQGHDTKLLFGRELKANDFNDNNVGKVLDNIHSYGASQLFSQLSFKACEAFSLNLKHQHFDTTSVSVWGDYASYANETENTIAITKGHSKDHRPDLKQFLYSCLCVEGNIPLLGAVRSGNQSDKKANNKELTRIASFMNKHGLDAKAHLYIADSAAITAANLEKFMAHPFVSRLPATYNAESKAIEKAYEENRWQDIGPMAEIVDPAPNRPSAYYKLCETEIELYGRKYRGIVVHSSSHDKRRLKKLEKALNKEREEFTRSQKEQLKIYYNCQEDAQTQIKIIQQKQNQKYHRIEGQIKASPRYSRGRPAKGKSPKVKQMLYQIELTQNELNDLITETRERSGCFVLLSNAANNGEHAYCADELLLAYKQQYGIEMNFRFLKDPLIVNDTFLKKAERIEALGVILLLSLMVWNLIQHCLRKYIKETQMPIMGWDNKPTKRPTTFMLLFHFQLISIFRYNNKTKRQITRKLLVYQQQYLHALQLDESIFTTPP